MRSRSMTWATWTILVPLPLLVCASVLAQDKTPADGRLDAGRLDVGRFSFNAALPALPSPWQVLRFDQRVPATQYRVMLWDGVAAVEAVANASMALLARPVSLELARTPILCWRWRVDAPLVTADLATKQGDDYAARVYLAFKLAPEAMSFATRAKLAVARGIYGGHVPDAALNYVWDNRYPIGTRRPNAYTDRTNMVVLRSGPSQAGAWVTERRDVFADAVAAFGTDQLQATQLAIAADTDNTGERARSGFADLHFVARDQDCAF